MQGGPSWLRSTRITRNFPAAICSPRSPAVPPRTPRRIPRQSSSRWALATSRARWSRPSSRRCTPLSRTWPSPRPSTATALSRATISCAPPSSSAISMRSASTSPTTRSSSPTAQSPTAATSATSWTLTTWWPCATRCIPCMSTPTPWPAAQAITTRPPNAGRTSCTCPPPPRTAFARRFPRAVRTSSTCAARTTPPARCSTPSS